MKKKLTGKICASISATSQEEMASKAAVALSLRADLVEFRMDHLDEPAAEATNSLLSEFRSKAIVTVRSRSEGGRFKGSERERTELLGELASLRPAFVDVELRTLASHEGLRESLKKTSAVVSWHDLRSTPSSSSLRRRFMAAKRYGKITKIVTTAKSFGDNLRVLGLYDGRPEGLVAFCMGEQGMISRVLSFQFGAPLVYGSLPGEPLAPGQMSVTALRELAEMMDNE